MKRLLLIAAVVALPGGALAQGVNEPSTGSRTYIIVNPPQQPAPPNATPNIPTRVPVPPLGVRRAHPYHPGTHGSHW